MKHVFVAYYGYDYEGEYTIGVYTTLRRAKTAVGKATSARDGYKKIGDYRRIDKFELNTGKEETVWEEGR